MDSRIFFLPLVFLSLCALSVWWFVHPGDFALILAVTAIANIVAALWLNKGRRDWWSFMILPILLLSSGFSYGLIVSDQRVVIAVLLVTCLATLMYWRLVFLYTFKHASYRPFSLERLSSYVLFTVVFFSSAAVYGLRTFLDLPAWQLFTLIFLVQIGVVYEWLWVHKTEFKKSWRYGLGFIVIILELFLIFGLLPLEYNILGFMLASVWYAFSSLAIDHLAGRHTPTRSRLIIGFVVMAWLLVLLTARWF